LSSLNDTKKNNLDKKIYLQSQTKFFKVKNLQPSLLPPPSINFRGNNNMKLKKIQQNKIQKIKYPFTIPKKTLENEWRIQ
jgi:hypothetical protein